MFVLLEVIGAGVELFDRAGRGRGAAAVALTGSAGRSRSVANTGFFARISFNSGLRRFSNEPLRAGPRAPSDVTLPVGSLPSNSRARLRLVGAAIGFFEASALKAPCSYFLRMNFSTSLSLSSAPKDVGGGCKASLGFQMAFEALFPVCRIAVICSRVQESSVTDFLQVSERRSIGTPGNTSLARHRRPRNAWTHTRDRCVPSLRWTEAQWTQRKIPRLTLAHLGAVA